MAQGITLDAYGPALAHVAPEHDECPVRSFDPYAFYREGARDAVREEYGTDEFEQIIHRLPVKALQALGTGNAAMAFVSRTGCGCSDAERDLCKDPVIDLVRKIRSSMWRWGHEKALWNEIVDAYDGIRSFDPGVAGFDVQLTYTTGYNENGNNCREHAGEQGGDRVWLDGVFGFLVRWKGEHVMTIGFTVVAGRRILLQQVQAASKTGNRWMFRLPANRMEFVIDRLRTAFPGHAILVADGADYASVSMDQYRRRLETVRARTDKDQDDLDEIAHLRACIANLKRDVPRIAALYRDVGRHGLGEKVEVAGRTHYALAA
jgi:hypothetical protein